MGVLLRAGTGWGACSLRELKIDKYKGSVLLKFAVLCFAAFAVVSLVGQQLQISEKREELAAVQEQLSTQLTRNEEIQNSLDNSGGCDLTYVDSTVLANNFLQWNSGMISGLIYRRIAECNIFFFGDYDRAMKDKGYWGENTYGYHFPENISQYDSTQN